MKEKEIQVAMHTSYGTITLRLYNETPQHRDNFLKLVDEKTYDGLLFHRVIQDFMIQGGDVTSKEAPLSKQLGAGDLGYTVPAEFAYPKRFHKKGALAAARTGDAGNPLKASSASQFYIVTGKVYSDAEMKQLEKQRQSLLVQSIFNRLQGDYKQKILELYRNGEKDELLILKETLIGKAQLEAESQKDSALLPAELQEAYKTIGGTPFLDNEYTVFGEVIDGMDVIEKIEQTKTNSQDRPLENIMIQSVERIG